MYTYDYKHFSFVGDFQVFSGAIRLVGGSSPLEGRVEINYE